MPRKAHLLLVDDDPNTLASLSRAFRMAGHEVTVCDNASRAVELLRSEPFDLVFSDVVMPGKTGIDLLEELKSSGIKTPIIMISGQANIEMAVRATRLGALDFLEKPLSTDKLLLTIENALRLTRLENENQELRHRLGKHELVGNGAAMKRLMAEIERVAPSETRVCILGETGTGKELVARAIHEKSNRRENAFVTLNCAAVPAELIESALFGHEKGSFTGAAAKHLGKFEQADGGTLFLDEIGDMPLAMQAKLLRVLEEGEVERVGGDKAIRVNVRVLVATHRDLEKLVKENGFRQDLFHRVYVFPLRLPTLRERKEDLPVLIAHFASQVAAQNGWKKKEFDAGAVKELQHYSWPGNVRELRNVVERLILLSAQNTVTAADVRLVLPATGAEIDAAGDRHAGMSGTLAERTENFERDTLLAEIRKHNFHMTNVARAMGLERSHLYKKCQQLGIDLQEMRNRREQDLQPHPACDNNAVNPWLIGPPLTLAVAAAVTAYGAVHPHSELFGPMVWRTNSPRKLAITFDDGPNPKITPELLNVLDGHHARATFFVIGRFARECPDLVRETAQRGHVVANHSDHHVNLFWRSPSQIRDELRRCNEAIAAATGAAGKWFRPPFGMRNPWVISEARALGLRTALWTRLPGDWRGKPTGWLIARMEKIAKGAQSAGPGGKFPETGGGDILCLHDGDHRFLNGDRGATVAALQYWLPRWRDLGLEFVTIDEAVSAPAR